MKFVLKFCFLLLLVLIGFSCSSSRKGNTTAAVYHWQSVFELSAEETEWLQENEINKIYLRVFDIDWDQTQNLPTPIGDVKIVTSKIKDTEIVPVVFITNKTLLNIPDSSIKNFAENIFKKVKSKELLFSKVIFNELQIDCDWTETSSSKYFALLKEIKSIWSGKTVSATIRLHQVKYYKKTGVPPVDRGMLMFYNIGRVENIHTINSIYEKDIAKQYMYNFNSYPLQLDVALPAFSWGVVFRNKRFYSLVNEPDLQYFISPDKFRKVSENLYSCLKETVYNGTTLKKDDLIRLEIIDPEITKSAARLASQNIKNKKLTAALYHLNEGMIKRYEKKEINSIVDCFN